MLNAIKIAFSPAQALPLYVEVLVEGALLRLAP